MEDSEEFLLQFEEILSEKDAKIIKQQKLITEQASEIEALKELLEDAESKLEEFDLIAEQYEKLKIGQAGEKLAADQLVHVLLANHEDEKRILNQAITRLEYQVQGIEPSHQPAGFIVLRAPLNDLPLFGEKCPAEELNFRWPTDSHLRAWDSLVYPRLQEVSTRGPGCLTGLRLGFQRSICSTTVFSHEEDHQSQGLQTVPIAGKSIRRVIARVNVNVFGFYINHLRAVLQDGTETVIFDQSNLGKEYEVEVPERHVIVGFFGKTTVKGPKRICSLGFIVMDTTELISD